MPSASLVQQPVCSLSGLLPAAGSPGTIREWFLAGTQPEKDASDWFAKDPGGLLHPVLPSEFAGWTKSAFNHIGALPRKEEPLKITAPADHAQFVLEPSLPVSQQMIELSSAGGGGRAVHWFINDRELAERPDGKVFWRIEPGAWQISARTEGQTAQISIAVETPRISERIN